MKNKREENNFLRRNVKLFYRQKGKCVCIRSRAGGWLVGWMDGSENKRQFENENNSSNSSSSSSVS